ncbi:MAG: hypothetical protein [Asgard archaea virus VerdaV3]|nr:MAG: hypothetical protein [Asgard archaea virus VerdaV3]
MKPKDEKKASESIKDTTEEIFESVAIAVKIPEGVKVKTIDPTGYVPGTVRLMTIFELLTDKSFPRKGPGKSTREKILDAIVMAALDKKLILQEEKDA